MLLRAIRFFLDLHSFRFGPSLGRNRLARIAFMRMLAIIVFALLLAAMPGLTQPATNNSAKGGMTSQPGQSLGSIQLTSSQATALAIRLANDKADALFHHRPFKDGQPAQLVTGKWVWTDGCGVALMDYHASVVLGSNGSTNRVDIQVWDDSLRPLFFRNQPGFPPPSLPPGSRMAP